MRARVKEKILNIVAKVECPECHGKGSRNEGVQGYMYNFACVPCKGAGTYKVALTKEDVLAWLGVEDHEVAKEDKE